MNGFQRCLLAVTAFGLLFMALTAAKQGGVFNGLHLLMLIAAAAAGALSLPRKHRS